MSVYFLDTSAVLHSNIHDYAGEVHISPITLMELENIKNSNKDENIKYLARKAVRDIIDSRYYICNTIDQKKVDKKLKQHKFLSNINDHRILCEAELLAEQMQQSVYFVTADGAQILFAQQMHLLLPKIVEERADAHENEWCGWSKYYPSAEQMAFLYSDPKINTLKCKTNEFAEIYEGSELKDILFWTGENYRPLKYKEVRDKTLGESIKPLNREQKMAFDLLQNQEIPVKLLVGAPGTGKDMLMIMHAIDLLQRGIMDKIIFVRNLVPFKDAPEIGFLSGNLEEKISWGLGPLRSILGEEGLMMYEEKGMIEAVNLGFIRGCSWDRTIIYVSEGQNITGGGYKLLISRCGKGSQLWVNGDILQTDDKKFETNNGLTRLVHSLQGDPLFGMVKLLKTERSEVAELAARI